MQKISCALFALFSFISFSAQAGTSTATSVSIAEQSAKEYGIHAKKLDPKSTLSAEAGRAFYTKKVEVNGKDLSCSACHTDNPASTGKHNETGKAIKPLAPSANSARFSNRNKAEKGFTKHCKDLYGKNCTPQEKGDFITYLLTVQ
ncbi:MAG: DUF1924 domain-containing protein [Gallionella sp.]|nr:DUF1924 domain-containing protein [Gallionella sp.]